MSSLNDQLFAAALEGKHEEVARLVKAGADVNAHQAKQSDHGAFLDGVTPLMIAAASPRSNSETVRAILAAGADLFAVSDGEVTALWYAAGGGTGYALTPDNLAQLGEGHPFLNWGGGDVDRLRLILDAGANPHEAADNGRTAVGEACSVGDPERLALLMDRGASAWPVKSDPHRRTAIPDLPEGMEDLVYPDKTNAEYDPWAIPLFQASESGCAECVKMILAQGFPADFNCQGETALEKAKTVEVVEALWEAGARPSNGRFSFDAVDDALEDERYPVAEFLIGRIAEADRSRYINEKLMTSAGVRMNPVAVKRLLEMGADPNYESKDLGCPLHWCCWQGDGNGGRENQMVSDTLEILISAGAEVNKIARRGSAPLHEAVQGDWGSPTAVRVLLAHGAEVDIRDADGATPLMLAANQAEVECIKLLLDAGADRGLRDRRRKTALDRAKGHAKVWRGIVRFPPKLPRFFGRPDKSETEQMHRKALAEAEEAVRLLEAT